MKSLNESLHMITFACFENQFRCSFEMSVVCREGKVGSQIEDYNISNGRG